MGAFPEGTSLQVGHSRAPNGLSISLEWGDVGRRQRWGAGRTLDRGLLSPALGGKAKEGGGLGLVTQLSLSHFPQVMELPCRRRGWGKGGGSSRIG